VKSKEEKRYFIPYLGPSTA